VLREHGGLKDNVPLSFFDIKVQKHTLYDKETSYSIISPFDSNQTGFISLESARSGDVTSHDIVLNGIDCIVGFNHRYMHLHVYTEASSVASDVFCYLNNLLFEKVEPLQSNEITIFSCVKDGCYWQSLTSKHPRDLSTIYIDTDKKMNIIDSISEFIKDMNLYQELGIPYKFNMIFKGPPGTGKSSMAFAIASYFNRSLYTLTVTPRMTSENINILIHSVKDKGILLIEDIDCMFKNREAVNSARNIDMSTFLNELDGVLIKHGLIIIMTTNHYDKLDPALVRPGRIDLVVDFKLPTRNEMMIALNKLVPEYKEQHYEFLDSISDSKCITIPMIQSYCFICKRKRSKTLIEHIELFNKDC
jgi:hypothetical protein